MIEINKELIQKFAEELYPFRSHSVRNPNCNSGGTEPPFIQLDLNAEIRAAYIEGRKYKGEQAAGEEEIEYIRFTNINEELQLVVQQLQSRIVELESKGEQFLQSKIKLIRLIDKKAIDFAHSKERVGCSYWNGLRDGYVAGASEYAGRRAQGTGWVSVEDGLPEESGQVVSVIVCLKSGEVVASTYYPSHEEFAGGNIVTHWMPLPSPPSPGTEDLTDKK